MRFRVMNSALRLSGTAGRAATVLVAHDGVATLEVEGEALATFPSLADLKSTFELRDADLEALGDG